MGLQRFFILCVIVCYAAAFPYRTEVPDEQSDSALGSLLEGFKDFNATALMASFRPPQCIQDCSDEVANSIGMGSSNSEGRWSTDKANVFCRNLAALKSCLAAKPSCDNLIVNIGMLTLDYLCSDDKSAAGYIPCVRRSMTPIHATCEKSCRLGATLMDAASLNAKKSGALNFVDEQGNKILSVPAPHVLCNTSTCFLSCMKAGLEEKCPNKEGNALIDNIVTSLMKVMTMDQFSPNKRISDGYATLISSELPKQCQHLVLEDKNIVLTTPSAPFTFVTDAPNTAVPTASVSVEAPIGGSSDAETNVVTENEGTLRDSGASKGDDGEEGAKKSNSGSTVKAVLPAIFTAALLTAYVLS